MQTKEIELGYSYINARIAGMKGILFSEKDYELLISKEDITLVFSFLKSTPYGEDIRRVKGSDNTERIREGLNRNVYFVFKKINRIVEGEPRRLLASLLGWWDIYNIKTILRGKQGDRSEEEIRSLLVATGTLCHRRLMGLLQQTDLKGLITALGDLGSVINLPTTEQALEIYLMGGSVLLESQIEKAYFGDALKRAKGEGANNPLAVKIIRSQIDRANIMTGLRIINKDGLNLNAHYIDGGDDISSSLYIELIKDKKRLMERLPHINKIISGYCIKEGDLRVPERVSVLERRLEMAMLKDLFHTSLIDTYSIGMIVSYIWRKVNEVININIILQGKLKGLANEAIKGSLVIV